MGNPQIIAICLRINDKSDSDPSYRFKAWFAIFFFSTARLTGEKPSKMAKLQKLPQVLPMESPPRGDSCRSV